MSRLKSVLERLEPDDPLLHAQFDIVFTQLSSVKHVWDVLRFNGFRAHWYSLQAMSKWSMEKLAATKRVPIELTVDLHHAFEDDKVFEMWIKQEFSVYAMFPGTMFHVDPKTIKILPPADLDRF